MYILQDGDDGVGGDSVCWFLEDGVGGFENGISQVTTFSDVTCMTLLLIVATASRTPWNAKG